LLSSSALVIATTVVLLVTSRSGMKETSLRLFSAIEQPTNVTPSLRSADHRHAQDDLCGWA
jgi:hypothetical protein